jgi:sugar-specific transcriptional regulator TrmB
VVKNLVKRATDYIGITDELKQVFEATKDLGKAAWHDPYVRYQADRIRSNLKDGYQNASDTIVTTTSKTIQVASGVYDYAKEAAIKTVIQNSTPAPDLKVLIQLIPPTTPISPSMIPSLLNYYRRATTAISSPPEEKRDDSAPKN